MRNALIWPRGSLGAASYPRPCFGGRSRNTSFDGPNRVVREDNFHPNSGELTCPDWWSDAWPDCQALLVDND